MRGLHHVDLIHVDLINVHINDTLLLLYIQTDRSYPY